MIVERILQLVIGVDEDAESGGEFAYIQTESEDVYFLWSDGYWPGESTAVVQVRRSMWISLCREAIANNLEVGITTSTDSDYDSKVVALSLYSA